MKTKIMSKLGRRGKIGLAVLIAAMFIGVASAGVLTYYGQVVTTATVEQSVLFDGEDYTVPISEDLDAIGGWTYYFKHDVENRAPINAEIEFVTTCSPTLVDDEIVTEIYALDPITTLELTSKNPDTWEPTADMKAILTFDTVATKFNYELTATGLASDTEYALIYYADFDPRFQIWGGNNPGAFIATFTTDDSGDIVPTSGSVNLAMNLPTPPDWNIDPYPDYCSGHNGYDYYDHCCGAKIWLVPSVLYDRDDCKVTSWQPTRFLFETDLVVYLDCNLGVEDSVAELIVDYYATDVTDGLTVPLGVKIPLLFSYSFDIAITPYIYTITTEIQPS